MAIIPKALHQHLLEAFPEHTCLIGSCLPDGYAQITPRGSVQAFDDEHIMLWERGRGSTTEHLHDGSKLTVYYQNSALRASILPAGGVARFYGVAKIYKDGPIYDQVWDKLIPVEKSRDPDKKGFAVLIKIERAENLGGKPLDLD